MCYLLVHDNEDGSYRQMGSKNSFRIGDTVHVKTTWKDPVKAYKSFSPFCTLCMFEINDCTSEIKICTDLMVNGSFRSSHGNVWIVNGKRSRKVTDGPAHVSINLKGFLNKNLVVTDTVRYEHYFRGGHVVTGPFGYTTISFDRFGDIVKTYDFRKNNKSHN